jgi:plasmid stability protein
VAHLQIKNLPAELHEELRRRALMRGLSVREYVLRLIEKDQLFPTREEWLDRVRSRTAVSTELSGAELVSEHREERERELVERHRG